MLLTANLKTVVVGATVNQYTKDGKEKTFYNLSLADLHGEVAQVPCSESVYQSVNADSFKKFSEHEFIGEYDTRWNRFSIISIK